MPCRARLLLRLVINDDLLLRSSSWRGRLLLKLLADDLEGWVVRERYDKARIWRKIYHLFVAGGLCGLSSLAGCGHLVWLRCRGRHLVQVLLSAIGCLKNLFETRRHACARIDTGHNGAAEPAAPLLDDLVSLPGGRRAHALRLLLCLLLGRRLLDLLQNLLAFPVEPLEVQIRTDQGRIVVHRRRLVHALGRAGCGARLLALGGEGPA